jgi:hypothetical protein
MEANHRFHRSRRFFRISKRFDKSQFQSVKIRVIRGSLLVRRLCGGAGSVRLPVSMKPKSSARG